MGLSIRYKIDLEFKKYINYKLTIIVKEKSHLQIEESKLIFFKKSE